MFDKSELVRDPNNAVYLKNRSDPIASKLEVA